MTCAYGVFGRSLEPRRRRDGDAGAVAHSAAGRCLASRDAFYDTINANSRREIRSLRFTYNF